MEILWKPEHICAGLLANTLTEKNRDKGVKDQSVRITSDAAVEKCEYTAQGKKTACDFRDA